MISKLRKRLLLEELPQYAVAAAMHIDPSTLSNYSLGRKEILPHHLIAMTRYWRCDANDILGYLDEPDILQWVGDSTLQGDIHGSSISQAT